MKQEVSSCENFIIIHLYIYLSIIQKSCQSCTGNGYYGGYYHKSALTKTLESSDYCWRCHGRGRLKCYSCNGDGMITCAACLGSGQIKCYIKMVVTL